MHEESEDRAQLLKELPEWLAETQAAEHAMAIKQRAEAKVGHVGESFGSGGARDIALEQAESAAMEGREAVAQIEDKLQQRHKLATERLGIMQEKLGTLPDLLERAVKEVEEYKLLTRRDE